MCYLSGREHCSRTRTDHMKSGIESPPATTLRPPCELLATALRRHCDLFAVITLWFRVDSKKARTGRRHVQRRGNFSWDTNDPSASCCSLLTTTMAKLLWQALDPAFQLDEFITAKAQDLTRVTTIGIEDDGAADLIATEMASGKTFAVTGLTSVNGWDELFDNTGPGQIIGSCKRALTEVAGDTNTFSPTSSPSANRECLPSSHCHNRISASPARDAKSQARRGPQSRARSVCSEGSGCSCRRRHSAEQGRRRGAGSSIGGIQYDLGMDYVLNFLMALY